MEGNKVKSEELKVQTEWKEVKLKDIADFQKGYAFKSKEFVEDGVKVVKVSNLTSDSISNSGVLHVEKSSFEKYQKYQLKTDDAIITTVGSWPNNPASVVGKVVRVPGDFDGSLLNQNAVRVTSKEVSQDFLYYLLKDRLFKHYIVNTAQGSASQASITQKDIKQYAVNIPRSLEECEKIGNILRALDEKIEVNNQMNQTLEEMAQAVFKEWFVEFNFPDENGVPYRDNGGEMVDSELGPIPKGWRVEELLDICIVNGSSYSKKDDWDYINYLDTSNITQNKIDTIQMIDCKNEKVPSRAKRKIKENSIVYSTVRPNQLHYGIIKKPIENMIVSTGFVTIDSKYEYIKNDFIYCWLTQEDVTKKLQVIAESSTTTYPSIKPGDIKSMKLVIADEDTMEKISQKLDKINLYMDSLKTEELTLKKIRDTLLPKLMSGEVRV